MFLTHTIKPVGFFKGQCLCCTIVFAHKKIGSFPTCLRTIGSSFLFQQIIKRTLPDVSGTLMFLSRKMDEIGLSIGLNGPGVKKGFFIMVIVKSSDIEGP